MLLFLTILFSIISIVLSVLLFYSLRRINNYENLIIQFQQIVEYTNERVKTIDASGHFESDDEIGFFFKEVQQLSTMLNDIFDDDEIQQEENKDGEK
jgi:hypothetical protein|tara:strand:- start:2699 stop:2989 length:291 start_codon:yes stop_codon:yes gene_type:complete